MAALTRASGRSPPPAPTPADGEFVSDVARGEQLVARAQRAIRSKSDNDRWLREQMSRLSDPQIKALTNDIFTDSGALRVSLAEVNARLARMHTADAAGGSAAEALSGDGNATEARVLPILRTSLGVRHRDFRSAVEAMRESAWEDWPLTGPRTVLFVLTFIAEHFQTPEQRHARFVADGKLQPTDVGVSDHQVVMKMLHYGAVYDQLDLPQMAWAELACRRAQLAELKHKEKFLPKVDAKKQGSLDPYDDAHLYLDRTERHARDVGGLA